MPLKIALAQINPLVGGIDANAAKIIDTAIHARDQLHADLIVFPELSVTGYPPEDLLLRPDFIAHAARAVDHIAAQVAGIDVVLGFPDRCQNKLYNSAAVLRDGAVLTRYRKNALPNYGVFDEKRYFFEGDQTALFTLKGTTIGITICEDVWHPGILARNRQAGAELVLTLNASPFHAGKIHEREDIIVNQIKALQLPLVYVNQVGGQDELIFDGASFVVDSDGEVVFRAEEFSEQVSVVEFEGNRPLKSTCAPLYSEVSSEYRALVLGIRDYVEKNGFQGAILGLSGGIDSALVAYLVAEAIGAERLLTVMMPYRTSSPASQGDAEEVVRRLGCATELVEITAIVDGYFEAPGRHDASALRRGNLMARARMLVLYDHSVTWQGLVVGTGNKTEALIGYTTLFGDSACAFNPIGDLYKSQVRQLSAAIGVPDAIIRKAPSADLWPGQTDETEVGFSYAEVDRILFRLVDKRRTIDEVVDDGFDRALVERVDRMVAGAEFKRQVPPIAKLGTRTAGVDYLYPRRRPRSSRG